MANERLSAQAGVENRRALMDAQARLAALEPRVKSLAGKRNEIAAIEDDRANLLRELRTTRQRVSRLMKSASRQLNEHLGSRVRVNVEAMADRSVLVGLISSEVAGQNVSRSQIERISRSAPAKVAKALRDGSEALVEIGAGQSTAAKLATLSPDTVRRVEEAATPDIVTIEINLSTNEDPEWVAIDDVSPGQRATAMLAIALASGSSPLVIDQPEDDLDNRYIYDEVVRVLADVCQGRQVIVATHNANIPVLGDAELVVAFEASAREGRVYACGGFEDARVTEAAREILEGGDDAFRARHRRYLAHR